MTLVRVDVTQSRDAVEDALAQQHIEPLVTTRDGKPVAALVPLENVDIESFSLSLNSDFMAMIEESRRSAEEEGTIGFDEMQRRLGISND